MDFWQAKRRAQKATRLYFFLFISMTLGVAVLIEWIFRLAMEDNDLPDYPTVGLAFAIITFTVALVKYYSFRSYGGSYAAESAGAELIDEQSANLKERELLNIVEEMALAAGIPKPPVYLIDAQQINAFAAGMDLDNAVIAVTKGALNKLTRDELQGVIAHEMGHILNGDMIIGLTLAAMVLGFFFAFTIGQRIIYFSSLSRRSDRSSKSNNQGGAIFLAALLFFAAGLFTWFFGSILKACVSRQREYLADASSVQFTRNPEGIANALIKIQKDNIQDMPLKGAAFSHLYFDNHSGWNALFATHPPLEKRIAALLGHENK